MYWRQRIQIIFICHCYCSICSSLRYSLIFTVDCSMVPFTVKPYCLLWACTFCRTRCFCVILKWYLSRPSRACTVIMYTSNKSTIRSQHLLAALRTSPKKLICSYLNWIIVLFAVGIRKVVTKRNGFYISRWEFENSLRGVSPPGFAIINSMSCSNSIIICWRVCWIISFATFGRIVGAARVRLAGASPQWKCESEANALAHRN